MFSIYWLRYFTRKLQNVTGRNTKYRIDHKLISQGHKQLGSCKSGSISETVQDNDVVAI